MPRLLATVTAQISIWIATSITWENDPTQRASSCKRSEKECPILRSQTCREERHTDRQAQCPVATTTLSGSACPATVVMTGPEGSFCRAVAGSCLSQDEEGTVWKGGRVGWRAGLSTQGWQG